jgi:hypothetical protein
MEPAVLRVVVFKQEDMFVAQCLEHDISVQAADIATLQMRFEETVAIEGEDLAAISPAPESFQKMWDDGYELESKIDNAEMRLAA